MAWAATYPGWKWFISNVLRSEDDRADLVHGLVCQLVPCYAIFTFASLFSGVLYALGRTDLLAAKTFVGNCIIVALFMLFTHGILFDNDVFGVAAIFGSGLVIGTVTSAAMLAFALRNNSLL